MLPTFMIKKFQLLSILPMVFMLANATIGGEAIRQQWLLSGAPWQFVGAGSNLILPNIDSREFVSSRWQTVAVPHVFQTRTEFTNYTQAWYRRDFTVPPDFSGRRLYLVFEGAATIADVYVNGKHLGQHRGAYTRFVFDATDAVKSNGVNALVVDVNNNPADTTACLPIKKEIFTVCAGLFRKVWLVSADSLHVDFLDYASIGVYITSHYIYATY